MYAGKALAEIAGYDDWAWEELLTRPRDRDGRLVRGGEALPPWVRVDADGMRVVPDPTPLEEVFKSVRRKYGGQGPAEAEMAWGAWLKDNPGFGKGGA